MKRSVEIVGAALLVAVSTLAAARTTAQSFADEFKVMQSYSGSGPMYHASPTLSANAQDPSAGLTENGMQALSNGDPTWQPTVMTHSTSAVPALARTNPHGLSFEFYQAASSNSDEFKLPPGSGAPAFMKAVG